MLPLSRSCFLPQHMSIVGLSGHRDKEALGVALEYRIYVQSHVEEGQGQDNWHVAAITNVCLYRKFIQLIKSTMQRPFEALNLCVQVSETAQWVKALAAQTWRPELSPESL